MRIGYGKIGRSVNLSPSKWSTVGGDSDVWRTLDRLARKRPNDTFVLLGRNTGEEPSAVGLPDNVENPWTKLAPLWRDIKKDYPGLKWSPMDDEARRVVIAWTDTHQVPLFWDLDHVIVWLGQHGTSCSPIPPVGSDWSQTTKPQDSSVLYGAMYTRGINAFRERDPYKYEEIWLCPDPRNYLKARDLRWPLRHPVLAQFDQERQFKNERYAYDEPLDTRFPVTEREGRNIWVSRMKMIGSGLEISALPDPAEFPLDLDSPREPFGMVINENRAYVANSRLEAMQQWVMPYFADAEMYGKWSPESEQKLGRSFQLVANDALFRTTARWRSTLTTPASGSGWATAKPWESFITGTVCFFHPGYDVQGHVIPTLRQIERGEVHDETLAHLAQWLRVSDPEQFHRRVRAVASDEATYRWLATAQRTLVEEAYRNARYIELIEERLDAVR